MIKCYHFDSATHEGVKPASERGMTRSTMTAVEMVECNVCPSMR